VHGTTSKRVSTMHAIHTTVNICSPLRFLFSFGCEVFLRLGIEIRAWSSSSCKTHASNLGRIGVWHSISISIHDLFGSIFTFRLLRIFYFYFLQQIPWASCWLQTDSF
jgi:hypothetical protein